MAKIEVVLEKIDVGKYVVEDHDVEPVGIVVIVERDGRSRVDNRFVWIGRIEFVPSLFFEHLHIVHPVVIEGGDHQFGG